MTTQTLSVGKLPAPLLEHLLRHYAHADERLVVGPRVGEDAAVIDFGSQYLVAKTDPITFATDQIGWYAVHVNANDLAVMGATPRWFLCTLLLPAHETSPAMVEAIYAQVSETCEGLGVSLCGGHTEVTYGLPRPLAIGMMLGEVEPDRLVTTAGAQIGDHLIVTKGVAVEGTAILARELGSRLQARFPKSMLARCEHFLFEPGISVVQDAEILCQVTHPHAMHDPTEGGLATGLWELAEASGHGVWVDEDRIPVLDETRAVCAELGLNPLGVIASGALLASVMPDESPAVLAALEDAGIGAAVIGHVVPASEGVTLRRRGGSTQLPRFDQDEITRLFG
jgi:hydrogenase expression/formation protein HypE